MNSNERMGKYALSKRWFSMGSVLSIGLGLLWVCCSKASQSDSGSDGGYLVRIAPRGGVRAAALNFEPGDRLGLRIDRASATYVSNALLTYDGTTFSGSVAWYSDTEEVCTLRAYYPYAPGGFPTTFEVAADQREGYAAWDLLGAVKEDATPSATPVAMLFRHLMSRLQVFVEDAAGHEVRSVVVSGLSTQARIDPETLTATAIKNNHTETTINHSINHSVNNSINHSTNNLINGFVNDSINNSLNDSGNNLLNDSGVSGVSACEEASGCYVAILVPQRGDMRVAVTLDDATTYEKTFPQVELLGGYDYDLSVRTSEQGMEVLLCGQIVDWSDGGTLQPEEEPLPDGTIIYAGERYRTQTIAGKCWMAENLRYIPEEALCEQDYWYPQGDAENASSQGILYTYHTATNNNNNNANYFNSNRNRNASAFVTGNGTGNRNDNRNGNRNGSAFAAGNSSGNVAVTGTMGMNGVGNTNGINGAISNTVSNAISCAVNSFVNDSADSADSAGFVDSAGSAVRGICPPGWHIPSAQELQELAACNLGEEFFACAGYYIVEDTFDKFAAPGQGMILSTSLDDENKMIVLKFAKPAYKTSIIPVPTNYAASIRCLKNE